MTTTVRATWSNKLAFVLAAAASAVGLGSMWRFPYLAAKYGGGTFLFMYLVFVFTIGIALLLLETAFGRKTGQSSIGAFKAFGKKYAFIGIFMSSIHRAVLLRHRRLDHQVHGGLHNRRARGVG